MTLFQLLHAFVPATNDLTKSDVECKWLISVSRAVELITIHERSRVVHYHLGSEGYEFSVALALIMNRHLKFIYSGSYDLSTVRLNLYASTFSTALATGALFMVNPYLAMLSLYDWYLLAAFSS